MACPFFTAASSYAGKDPKDPHFRLAKALHVVDWNLHSEDSVKLSISRTEVRVQASRTDCDGIYFPPRTSFSICSRLVWRTSLPLTR